MTQKDILLIHLKKYFGYDYFKPGQREIIEDVLKGRDVLGVLPTGTGKSLCYQFPALLNEGTTIVITPLISLMIDQVRELKSKKIREVVALNSFIPWHERQEIYDQLSTYKIIYISPELIQHDGLFRRLQNIHINLFVVDEAHCISQWGHEFRTDYLKLKDSIQNLNNPPVLAITATATKQVQNDILNILQRPKAIRHIYPIDRPNLAFSVESLKNDESKNEELLKVLKRYHVPTLVYFSSRQKSEMIAEEIRRKLSHLRIAFYHGGMDSVDRLIIQQQFMNDQIDVICCTSAFGMGINKPNIRLIIHYHFPSDLESYIQEIGRAGRDGIPSLGLVLCSQDDISLQQYMIKNRFPEWETMDMIEGFLLGNAGENIELLESTLLQIVKEDETHLKFLRYQIEKHGILDNNRITQKKEFIVDCMDKIRKHIQIRKKQKMNKLEDMIKWLHTDLCLRTVIYEYFNSSYKEAILCCSNCGFSIHNWAVEQSKNTQENKDLPWTEKLSKILLTEEFNE